MKMKIKYQLIVILFFTLNYNANCQTILSDDFENYPSNSIFKTKEIDHWAALNGNSNGGAEIVTTFASSGSNSMRCEDIPGVSNCLVKLLLGDKEEGVYTLSWKMRATNSGDLIGGFSFLDLESSLSLEESGPIISLGFGGEGYIANGIGQYTFEYGLHRWVLFEALVDLDDNKITLYVNDGFVGTLKYSSSFYGYGENNISHLGALSFAGGIPNYPFYIDDVLYSTGRVLSSVKTPNEEFSVKLYPNPARDHLLIQTEMTFKGGVCILRDALGKLIRTHPINDKLISISLDNTLPKGIYYCQFLNNRGYSTTQKLVIH